MFERLVALQVDDDEGYAAYRRGMTPILEEYGGTFGHDFRVSEVLISSTEEPINRVFTLRFPDEPTAERFFSDGRYLEVRRRYFDAAVRCVTLLAQYET